MTLQLETALKAAAVVLVEKPELGATLAAYFRGTEAAAKELPTALRRAADDLAVALPALSAAGVDAVTAAGDGLLTGTNGDVVMTWCLGSAWRFDAFVAPLLMVARTRPELAARVAQAATERVVGGPLWDALHCAPLMGPDALADGTQARARLEILIWEAGAGALEVPAFGQWLWSSPEVYERLVGKPAYGALRGRVLAASCLEISVCAVNQKTNQELVDRTLKVLQPLLLHPEPLVWIHAARALGRLTGPLEQLQGMLLDWVMGDSPVLRQRAITAFASLPADRLGLVASQLISIVVSPSEDPLVLAAVAAATPYLFFERRDIWDKMAKRILAGDGGALTARVFARGLATLWRRGGHHEEILPYLRALRTRSLRVESCNLSDMRRWIELGAVTDAVDGAERDPLDLEMGLDNLMRVAAQYDDPEADARAARFARALAPTFQEALRLALEPGRPRQRAAALNAVEACARAFALRLWSPLVATSPGSTPVEVPDLEETWKIVAATPATILDQVKERRRAEGADVDADVPLEALALRLGGYALDACGEDTSLGPGSGPTAHEICLWLRKLQGLTDGSRQLPPAIESALSALFWRLVDTTRGSTLGEADDVAWLGPFAAWWALVIDRPAVLERLATALPMLAANALKHCCAQAQALRELLSAKQPNGTWGPKAGEAFIALQALNTELAHALASVAKGLAAFANAAGPQGDLEARCLDLVLSGDRLQAALSDPVKGLHGPRKGNEDTLARSSLENAPRRAALVARAIRARDISMLEVWLASLGPVASAMIEASVVAAIERTPAPPPKHKDEPKVIEGYELIKTIGEGGIGSVWLVRKPGADRMFVLKIPKAEALSKANENEAKGILASFVEEAAALAGLYHPNVANIIDRGVSNGIPFLVLEYLIGADLKQYSEAKLMSLVELRQIVIEACAGLQALHGAGLVHRDIKPANLWLRLPLAGGERFDPLKHRDPAVVPPLTSVVIDFGMVRAAQVSAEAAGRFVAGTAGYIAPEQVLDPVYLHPRADLYSLAGTIYKVTTGRTFFDGITNDRERIIAHMHNDPFEEADRLNGYPEKVAALMRAATTRKPEDRPTPLEFAREFAASL